MAAIESRGEARVRRNQVMKSHGLALRSAGEGPLLLLLHGLGSSSLDWQAQIEHFSQHYRVVALDLRGHGQSMQEGPFDVATLAADVVNWLDEQPEPAGYRRANHHRPPAAGTGRHGDVSCGRAGPSGDCLCAKSTMAAGLATAWFRV